MNGEHKVLHVVEEIDDLMTALRFLVRTCESRGFHCETHALELALELLLRRRNYILNVTSNLGRGPPPYDSFPCETCYITYSTVFIMSWLEYVLNLARDSAGVCNADTGVQLNTALCKRSCAEHFGTPVLADHLTDGVLYPIGVPYVPGPKREPPDDMLNKLTGRKPGEFDEIRYVRDTVGLVLERLDAEETTVHDRDGEEGSTYSEDRHLAETVFKLLDARRHFGFDMDCVSDEDVERYRKVLVGELKSRDIGLLRR